MLNTSTIYKQLFESGAVQEYRITLDGVVYDSDVIYDNVELLQKLYDKETFTVGSFTVDTLKVKLKVPSDNIPRRASFKFEYRYVDGSTTSEWITKFKGNVSKRTEYTEEVTTLEIQSVAANYDVALDQMNVSEYPANARTVTTQLASYLGLTVDNLSDIINQNVVEFPNEMTVIEVLKNIAKLSGGNFIIVGDKLRLVKPQNKQPLGEYGAMSVETYGLLNPISKVTMYFDDESAFEKGNDNGSAIEIHSKWATQQTTDYVHGVLNGYEYVPVKATGAYIDPALEVGDVIEIDDTHITMANVTWVFDGSVTATIHNPIATENNYDEPYNKLVQQQFKKKVSLGDSYQGVTISRDKGMEMLMSPDGKEENATGKAYFDLHRGMAFQYRDEPQEEWKDFLYFDVNEKRFKINLEDLNHESVVYNGSGEMGHYANWKFPLTNEKLRNYAVLRNRAYMNQFTNFIIVENDDSLAGFDISFINENVAENGPYRVFNEFEYGFKIKRSKGNHDFTFSLQEYDKEQVFVQEQNFNFTSNNKYESVSNIKLNEETYWVGLKLITPNVSFNNPLNLTEMTFGIGLPKDYTQTANDVLQYAKSLFDMQNNKIELAIDEIKVVDGKTLENKNELTMLGN